MNTLLVHAPSGLASGAPSGYLYFNEAYAAIHPQEDTFRVVLADKKGTVCASAIVQLYASDANMYYKAPWGGIDSIGISDEAFDFFLQEIEQALLAKGCTCCTISLPPKGIYGLQPAEQYLRNGYTLLYEDLNWSYTVDEPFEKLVCKNERKRMKKAQREGVRVEEVPMADPKLAHSYLHEFRAAKGIPFNLTAEVLEQSWASLPKSYIYFQAFLQDAVVGAALCVVVSPVHLYLFAVSTDQKFNHLSPSVLLYKAAYDKALQMGAKLLDVGTSTAQGIPTRGLGHFKEKMGATPLAKSILKKPLVC